MIIRSITGLIFLILLLSQAGNGEEVRCDNIQHRLNRFYFDIGTENDVLANTGYTLYKGDSALFRSNIEWSAPGISISQQLAEDFNFLSSDSLYAIITTPKRNYDDTITVGYDFDIDPGLIEMTSAYPVKWQKYTNSTIMQDDLNDFRIDAILSLLLDAGNNLDSDKTVSTLPVIVTLLPEIGKSINRDGLLTTSLYYRFDPDQLYLVGASSAQPVTNFIDPPAATNESQSRTYPYDINSGKNLFNRIGPIDSVSIYMSSPMFEKLGYYLADVLSRDRCRVKFVEVEDLADISIIAVPYSVNIPSTSCFFLKNILNADSLTHKSSEVVHLLNSRLQQVGRANNSDEYYHWLRLADRSLQTDLGIFPLFSPRIKLMVSNRIRNLYFDSDGLLNTDSLYSLELPTQTPIPEEQP